VSRVEFKGDAKNGDTSRTEEEDAQNNKIGVYSSHKKEDDAELVAYKV
jgi:hypothetical protein